MDYKTNANGTVIYAARVKEILYRSRYPRYIDAARSLFGCRAQLIVADVVQHGRVRIGAVLERMRERETAGEGVSARDAEEETVEMFGKLVDMQYLCCAVVDSQVEGAKKLDLFRLPDSVTSFLQEKAAQSAQPVAKRRKLDPPSSPRETNPLQLNDGGIYYRLNFNQFHRHFLNQAIISAAQIKFDPAATVILRTVLEATSSKPFESVFGLTTAGISSFELFQHLPAVPILSRDEMSQYLTILGQDQVPFLVKTGEQGGGTYAVNIRGITDILCEQTIESVVRERFGSRSLRVFRLLLAKKHLEQKQVGELAMIPAKESKELLYKLFIEGFVSVQELPRTADHAPSRTFYLFAVNLDQVRRKLLAQCYETAANLISRRHSEVEKCERLDEKSRLCEMHAEQLKAAGNATKEDLDEVEEIITPGEREQLKNFKETVRKLEQAELQLDDTIMALSRYQ